ncbi:cache domain-containing protein [Nocardioides sp. SYSU DS0651]|uniref:cache domain-containing protein n=1 Tax=Nocardioides sp. SYSU DS0651 TaxID=3415955 RepID=UPI003F4B0529
MSNPTKQAGGTGRTAKAAPAAARGDLPAEVERVRQALDALVGDALALADRIAAAVEPALASRAVPARGDLAAVEPLVTPVLADAARPIQGAGFVAERGLLRDAPWWLEWFARDDDGRVQRLVTHSDPKAIGFYDYESLPWFVVPRDTGRNHVTGPYVDYLCTEEYTLTFTTPVRVDGRFVGVAGADIAVKQAEQRLLPALCAAESRLAVVNGDGRILSSNSGRHVCGDLLPASGRRKRHAYPMGDLPLTIVSLGD